MTITNYVQMLGGPNDGERWSLPQGRLVLRTFEYDLPPATIGPLPDEPVPLAVVKKDLPVQQVHIPTNGADTVSRMIVWEELNTDALFK